ncbi:alpha/beta fold hydrolase [Paenibacillus segetis]|uniref:Carboxylesterase nap n=1 Tax=Paenibacillus segetis TaxID=1325360 RepID=A0ABQ1YIS6_9BACL|nr:alpha/beta hydrolase [Paenibacillus segetis]GGH27036.1 putative carboxylesterase nap [Paenibacillus segetis]
MERKEIHTGVTSSNPIHFTTVQKEMNYNLKYEQSLALWSVPYKTWYEPTRFGQTHIISCGPDDGEPLILLHAMGFSSTVWFPNIEVLAQRYKVYAIDFIGDLNRSAPSILPANRDECGEWLDEVLDRLEVTDCIIGGISYGGYLAINYAIYATHRIQRLFLLSPAASFVPLHKQFIYRIIVMNAIPMKWSVHHFIKWLSKHKLNKTLIDQFHAAFRYGSLSLRVPPGVYSDDELKRLDMPILLLLGDQEVISDANLAYTRATQLCKNIYAEIIPGAGHLLNLEKPEYVNMKINEFL